MDGRKCKYAPGDEIGWLRLTIHPGALLEFYD